MYPTVTFDDYGNILEQSEETVSIERYNITWTEDDQILAGVDIVATPTSLSVVSKIEDTLELPYYTWTVFEPIH